MALVVDAVAIGGLDRIAMIDLEGSHLHTILFQVGHQIFSAGRADDVKASLAAAEYRTEPAGQPDIRDAGYMVGVVMRDEQRVDLADWHLDLAHSDRNAPAGIEQQNLSGNLDQRARSISRWARRWRRGSEQRHLEVALS